MIKTYYPNKMSKIFKYLTILLNKKINYLVRLRGMEAYLLESNLKTQMFFVKYNQINKANKI